MIQHQNTLEVTQPGNYIAHHISIGHINLPDTIMSSSFSNWYSVVSRAGDIIFSIVFFAVFILFIPFVWLANFLFSKGPLFYKQKRVGKSGKIFTIIKFRSMHTDAEPDGPRFTSENDERITTVGDFLRKSRIDELPQVINILRGDMTLIGPRPERPEFVKEFIRENPDYRLSSLVKPGLTGWGQVKYKYTSNIEEGLKKLEYDLHFIKNRNPSMDFEVLWRTVVIVLSRTGT